MKSAARLILSHSKMEKGLPQSRGTRPNQGCLHLTKDLDQRKARVSKQVKSRFSRRRRRSPPDSSGLPGARAPA